MKVIGIDGHLVIDGGETVGFSDAVRDERGVAQAFGQVAFIAGEQQHMFEIDVARFQDTHHLNAFYRLSVEGDTGGRNNLRDESLQGENIDLQAAAFDEFAQTIQKCIHAKQTLLCQG